MSLSSVIPEKQVRDLSALVLCGGGSRGAMEVGFYQALTELGIRVDFVLGSSIGALNGAYIAGGMPPWDLARLWRDFRLRQALRPNWAWLWQSRRQSGFFTLDPLRALLHRTLPVTRFEDLAIPLTIVTTDVERGDAAYWEEQGDLIEPVVASLSLPGVFTPRTLNGRLHVDGSIANDVPIDKAVERGAHRIYMIQCTCGDYCPRPVRGIVDVLVRSFSIALDGKYRADLKRFNARVEIHALRPRLAREVDLLDFRRSDVLIEAAYHQTLEYFQAIRRPAPPAMRGGSQKSGIALPSSPPSQTIRRVP